MRARCLRRPSEGRRRFHWGARSWLELVGRGRLVLLPRRSAIAGQLAVHRLADARARAAPHAERVDDTHADDVVGAVDAELGLGDGGEVDVDAHFELELA